MKRGTPGMVAVAFVGEGRGWPGAVAAFAPAATTTRATLTTMSWRMSRLEPCGTVRRAREPCDMESLLSRSKQPDERHHGSKAMPSFHSFAGARVDKAT